MLEEGCTAMRLRVDTVTDKRYTSNLPAQEVIEVATWQLHELCLMLTFVFVSDSIPIALSR